MLFIWLGAILFTIAVEAATVGLVSVWFIPGEIIALILAALNVGIAWQIGVFFVVSVITVPVGIKLCKPLFKKTKTNIDAIIGKTALITEEVHNIEARGAAKLDGKEWSARAENDETVLNVGEYVEVVAIQGVKLVCKRK